jgi:hypothetical protein
VLGNLLLRPKAKKYAAASSKGIEKGSKERNFSKENPIS